MTPLDPPKAPPTPILTERLLREGEMADLKDEIIDPTREREYVKKLNATDRSKLKMNFETWRGKRDALETEVKEMQSLFDELRADIEREDRIPPVEKIEKSAAAGMTYVADGLMKIPEYAVTEAVRAYEAPTLAEKAVIVGKNVLIAAGVLWAAKWANRGINWVIEKTSTKGTFWRGVLQVLKWSGFIGITGFALNSLAGTPAHAASTASPMPGVAPTKPGDPPETVPTMEMLRTPDGTELLTPFVSSPTRTLNVALDDTTSFKILDPVNEKDKRLDGIVEIDGQKYSIKTDITGTPLDGTVTKLLSSLKTTSGPMEKLNMIKTFTGVRKNKDRLTVNLGLLGGSLDIPLKEIKNAVETVKADKKKSSKVTVPIAAEHTFMGTTKPCPLPVTLEKI